MLGCGVAQGSRDEVEKRGDGGDCDRPLLRLSMVASESAAAAKLAATAVRQASERSALLDVKRNIDESLIRKINNEERVGGEGSQKDPRDGRIENQHASEQT